MRVHWRWRRFAAATAVALTSGVWGASLGSGPSASATTSDGWRVATQVTTGVSWYATTYGAGRFVVVGHGAMVATSAHASAWVLHPAPAGQWQSVTYGAGRFVALSARADGLEEMTSSDVEHWRARPGPRGEWTGVAYGYGRFVAVSAEGQFITSLDGLSWSPTWTRSEFLPNSVAYGNGRFVAVDSAQGDALISLDGVNWSFYPVSTPGAAWFAVAYGNGVFSAFNPAGWAATSMLGYVWVTHPTPAPQQINAATFGCGGFVATGQEAHQRNQMITSPLGAQWSSTSVPRDVAADWPGVAYGDHTFVAVDTAGTIATRSLGGYCGPTVASPPRDVSGNVASGQVWTYQHPSTDPGGAPIDAYLVTLREGTRTWTCHAPVYYQPNCIIRGLRNRVVYELTTQAHNRFGYSAPTDPEWVVAVAHWSLQAVTTTPTVSAARPVLVQVTGVIANAEGIYPQSPVTVHFGARTYTCVPSPFGECLISVADPPLGRTAIWASYTGYGVNYRSAVSSFTVVPGA